MIEAFVQEYNEEKNMNVNMGMFYILEFLILTLK